MPESITTASSNAYRGTAPGTDHSALSRAPSAFLRERFLTELAYYEADKPYLTADKCAARCRWLSELLTAAYRVADSPSDP